MKNLKFYQVVRLTELGILESVYAMIPILINSIKKTQQSVFFLI